MCTVLYLCRTLGLTLLFCNLVHGGLPLNTKSNHEENASSTDSEGKTLSQLIDDSAALNENDTYVLGRRERKLRQIYDKYGRLDGDTWLSTLDESYSVGRYSGWVLFSICCPLDTQLEQAWDSWLTDGVAIITSAASPNKPSQAAVAPTISKAAQTQLKALGYTVTVLNEDLEQLTSETFNKFRSGKTITENFYDLQEIEQHLKEVQQKHPDRVKLTVIGESVWKRPILQVAVTSAKKSDSAQEVPVIFIDAGIHAREWLSVSTALYVLQRLLEEEPELTQGVEWRIVPVANPDGYYYTWQKDRLWRKNRHRGTGSLCVGVDINRNFDINFGGEGSEEFSCLEDSHGPSAFSEPETAALRDAIMPIASRIKLYLSFHSYSQLFLLPWSYQKEKHPNTQQMTALGAGMAEAIHAVNGTKFDVGTATEYLYVASGTSGDWVSSLGVPYSYMVELQDTWAHGFLWPEDKILQAVTETMEGIRFAGDHIEKEFVLGQNPLQDDPVFFFNPSMKNNSTSAQETATLSDTSEGLANSITNGQNISVITQLLIQHKIDQGFLQIKDIGSLLLGNTTHAVAPIDDEIIWNIKKNCKNDTDCKGNSLIRKAVHSTHNFIELSNVIKDVPISNEEDKKIT